MWQTTFWWQFSFEFSLPPPPSTHPRIFLVRFHFCCVFWVTIFSHNANKHRHTQQECYKNNVFGKPKYVLKHLSFAIYAPTERLWLFPFSVLCHWTVLWQRRDKKSRCFRHLHRYSFCVQNENEMMKFSSFLYFAFVQSLALSLSPCSLLLLFDFGVCILLFDFMVGLQLRRITHLNWSPCLCYYILFEPAQNDKSWK